jgi:acyl-CoA synthetase (AMP-forming)/AMP-acid ligase II
MPQPPQCDNGGRAPLLAVPLDGLVSPDAEVEPLTGGAPPRDSIFDAPSLAQAFLSAAASRPEHVAIVTSRGSYSYAALARATQEIARQLRSSGLPPGGRVVLLLDNGPEYVAAFYGILLAGGVAVPLPPNVERDRLVYIARHCDVNVALTTEAVSRRRSDLRLASWRELGSAINDESGSREFPTHEKALAVILYTAGSSGEPKGVMLSDANLLANARSIVSYLPIEPGDKALALLPFFHAYGNSVLQTHLLRGATLVVDGSAALPTSIVEALRARRISSLAAVPEIYRSLLGHPELSAAALPCLSYMTVAGGAMAPAAVAAMARQIAPARFYVMYGQTEATARLAYLPPEKVLSHSHSIGRPIPGVSLEVRGEDGRPLPAGSQGTLWAHGDNIMLGYWRDPSGTAAAIRDGWLNTGDLAMADDDGFLYIQGRGNELVKIMGHRVHPREVERTIVVGLPNCRVAVVPFRQADLQRLALFIVPGQEELPTTDEIRQFCLRELPRHKMPAYIEVIAELPLNPALKPDYSALARRAESQSRQYVAAAGKA